MKLQHLLGSRLYFIAVLVSVGGLVSGCLGPRKVSDKHIQPVMLSEVAALHEAQEKRPGEKIALFLDSRPEAKFRVGHIPGARHLQLTDINPELKRDSAIEAFDEIIVYADNPGSASAKAVVKRMMGMRYDDVRLYAGGLEEWARSGRDVESVTE